MYCESCGNFIEDGMAFCENCGSPAPAVEAPAAEASAVEAKAVEAAPEAAPAPAPAPAPYEPAPVTPIMATPVAQPVQPVYEQPQYQQSSYQPAYQQPIYQQPMYQPVYQQPTIIYTQPVITPREPKKVNVMATAGLVFGILTLAFCWTWVYSWFSTTIFGLLALVFSIIGLVRKNLGGKGRAIAGLVCAGLGILGTILFWVLIFGLVLGSTELEEAMYDDSDLYSTACGEADSHVSFLEDDIEFDNYGNTSSGTVHVDGYEVNF